MFDAEMVKTQIIKWVVEYFKSTGSSDIKAVIGVSGGKDSSVTAALCAEALGKDRVLGVLIPQGEQFDIDVAYELCETLGIAYVEVNIKEAVQALYNEISGAGLDLNDVATFNTPARLRMAVLYAVSGVVGGRVVNTGNLSEDWVGYSTKFGDSAGDFAPLADLTVTEVKAVGKALGLSRKYIDKTPIDGLSGKTDEDNLGFTYEVLDRYIREGVCEDEIAKERIDRHHRMSQHKRSPIPGFKL